MINKLRRIIMTKKMTSPEDRKHIVYTLSEVQSGTSLEDAVRAHLPEFQSGTVWNILKRYNPKMSGKTVYEMLSNGLIDKAHVSTTINSNYTRAKTAQKKKLSESQSKRWASGEVKPRGTVTRREFDALLERVDYMQQTVAQLAKTQCLSDKGIESVPDDAKPWWNRVTA